MKLNINTKDIKTLNEIFKCDECQYIHYCYKYGKCGRICTGFDPIISNEEISERINDYLQDNIGNFIEKYNPDNLHLMANKCGQKKYASINTKEDSLYQYHVRYINDIIKEIRKGNTDYVYDTNKLCIIIAYEPRMRVTSFIDGCYYIQKLNN